MPDTTVAHNFGSIARDYDDHAAAQKRAARELLDFTPDIDPGDVLEPGCGTGIYTCMLARRHPSASIHAIDLSEEMVEVAREKIDASNVSLAVRDAEREPKRDYDLISSSATFQWFADLRGSLGRYYRALRGGGALSFSYFGPRTYRELRRCLAEVTGEGEALDAASFADKSRLSQLLNTYFRSYRVEERRFRQDFDDLRDLLRSIKLTGARGRRSGVRWTPGMLKKLERTYREEFGRIRATYQVFLCRGRT